ncbi:MAG: hypothetical protein VX653_03065 [Candidatus Thermoplasmatota archaeon]|nr:hypothetical protein [Candidatus Thermoplasmatota archaeon]
MDYRRIAKWASAISILLLIAFMAILPSAVDKMEPMLDPEQQNVSRLAGGESTSVDLVSSHVYVALRLVEDGQNPVAELQMIAEDGEEFSGDGPTRLHVDRVVNGTTYRPVRVFNPPSSDTYTLHNDGSSTLWLVDDSASELKVFTDPVVLAMSGACCLGIISGIIAMVFAFLMLQNKSKGNGKQVSGLIIDGRVMTTDELYRVHQQQDAVSDVPDPFVGTTNSTQIITPITNDSESQDAEEESDDAWKGWDKG